MEPRVDGEQEHYQDLVGEHDDCLHDMEAVPGVGAGGAGLVVHVVDVLVKRAPVEGAVGPVEPRVVEVIKQRDGDYQIGDALGIPGQYQAQRGA